MKNNIDNQKCPKIFYCKKDITTEHIKEYVNKVFDRTDGFVDNFIEILIRAGLLKSDGNTEKDFEYIKSYIIPEIYAKLHDSEAITIDNIASRLNYGYDNILKSMLNIQEGRLVTSHEKIMVYFMNNEIKKFVTDEGYYPESIRCDLFCENDIKFITVNRIDYQIWLEIHQKTIGHIAVDELNRLICEKEEKQKQALLFEKISDFEQLEEKNEELNIENNKLREEVKTTVNADDWKRSCRAMAKMYIEILDGPIKQRYWRDELRERLNKDGQVLFNVERLAIKELPAKYKYPRGRPNKQ